MESSKSGKKRNFKPSFQATYKKGAKTTQYRNSISHICSYLKMNEKKNTIFGLQFSFNRKSCKKRRQPLASEIQKILICDLKRTSKYDQTNRTHSVRLRYVSCYIALNVSSITITHRTQWVLFRGLSRIKFDCVRQNSAVRFRSITCKNGTSLK